MSEEPVDFSLIENQKENIEPSKNGRSAMALKKLFTTEVKQLKGQQDYERSLIEEKLEQIDELDDPIEPYLEYIEWVKRNYPAGPSVESGLIQILERCTSQFRDVPYYKNDPRYLQVWLSYAKYSENPRDIFVYLARKEIGKHLATYYEEYANYLETNDRNIQAEQVYQEGLGQEARPLKRLQKRFDEFKMRLEARDTTMEPTSPVFPSRSVLSVKSGTSLFASSHKETRAQKKIEIFTDKDDEHGEQKMGEWGNLGTAFERNKENKVLSSTWVGETLPQEEYSGKPKGMKVSVFQDSSDLPSGPVYKVIEVPGKKKEKVDLNFDLLYSDDEEFCVQEVLAIMKGVYRTTNQASNLDDSPRFKSLVTQVRRAQYDETIHLNKEELKKPASPTATFYTKQAKDEINAMFGDQSTDNINRDDDTKDLGLIYDDFTENVAEVSINDLTEKVTEHTKRKRDELAGVENIIKKRCVVNPADESFKEMLLENLNPSLNTYRGFYRYKKTMNMCSLLKKSLNIKQSRHVFVEFEGTKDPFNLKCLLGEGGFACVYLAESMIGDFKAIKCQRPSSPWEFYILRQIETRLKGRGTLDSIVSQSEIHVYDDESYLVLEYIRKGTILDVVNLFKTSGRKMDESLVMFFTCELIRVITSLHEVGIMHGDLKADNCMLKFTPGYENNRSKGWKSTGIKLIDFGRSIDMTLFPRNVEFRSNWDTDNQDCPEMRNQSTWTYQADYYGIASIIHTMLFGTFIETKFDGEKHVLVNPIKRYWQQDIWNPLLDILINSKLHGELPLTNKLHQCLKVLEEWLESNDSNLVSIMKDIEQELK